MAITRTERERRPSRSDWLDWMDSIAMRIGNTDIVTPVDDPCAYDPDWRCSVARCAVGLVDRRKTSYPVLSALSDVKSSVSSMYHWTLDDEWVVSFARFLMDDYAGSGVTRGRVKVEKAEGKRKKSVDDPKDRPLTVDEAAYMRVANMWHESPSPAGVRFRLEPLLLTGATMETIMLDISGGTVPVDVFRVYEKLFFNIRDSEWRLSKSCALRNSFAMPNGEDLKDASPQEVWRAIGAMMGYDVLVHVWMWRDAHGLGNRGSEFLLDETWRAAQARLFMSVFSDKIGHKSLSDILGAYTSQFKMLKDMDRKADGADDTTKTLMAILYQTAPHMVTVAQDVDAMNEETAAIQSRIQSQLAIERQKIEDKGAAVSNAVIDEQIAEAVKS